MIKRELINSVTLTSDELMEEIDKILNETLNYDFTKDDNFNLTFKDETEKLEMKLNYSIYGGLFMLNFKEKLIKALKYGFEKEEK